MFPVLVLSLYLAVYFIRPAEWIPGMQFPFQFYLGIIGILVIVASLLSQNRPRYEDRYGKYMIGLMLSLMVSEALTGWMGGVVNFAIGFAPALVCFYLVLIICVTPQRWQLIFNVLLLLILFIAFQAIYQINTGAAFGGLLPYMRNGGIDEFGNRLSIPQATWWGVFNDPNDLGMLLAIMAPFLLNKVMSKQLLYLLPLSVLIAAIIYTNSRGTLLALIAGTGIYFVFKKRSMRGLITAGVFGALIIMVGPSRMSEMGGGDESASSRLEAWYTGFQLFRYHPVFGIGVDNFMDHHYITAHNTFVLLLAEGGFLGLMLFNAVIVGPIYTAVKLIFKADPSKELLVLSALAAGAFSMCVSIMFISRPYVVLPYLYSALLIAYTRLHFREACNEFSCHLTLKNFVIITTVQIIAIMVMVHVLL